MRKIIDNKLIIIVFLISDLVLSYFIIIKNFFWESIKYNKVEKIISSIALLINISIVVMGFTTKMSYEISDKKTYEVIEQNGAIVSVYDGKFVVMDCEIQGETIVLKKGKFSLEEMTGFSITYHTYDKVVCE